MLVLKTKHLNEHRCSQSFKTVVAVAADFNYSSADRNNVTA